MSASEAYTTEPGSLQQREQIIDVWRQCLDMHENGEGKFDWFYAGCPWGPPLIQLLRYQPTNQIVGVAAIGRRRMLWQGREIRAGVFGDLAVLPEHRSFGPARTLLRTLFERSRQSLDLVYGMPNTKASALLKRATYTRIGNITRYAYVFRHHRYLAKRLPQAFAAPIALILDATQKGRRRQHSTVTAPKSEWAERADDRFDALWESSDHGTALVRVHDAAMARWRFDACPTQQTRYLLLMKPETRDLLAWFACRDEGAVLHVDDFWSEDAAAGIQCAYISALQAAARADGREALSVAFAGNRQLVSGWLQAGFHTRATRPIFGLRSDAGSVHGSIHLSAGDEDQ